MNIIVVGCGRVGAELAYRLYKNDHRVTVVDYTETAFHNLPHDFRGRTIVGEALNQNVLLRAGIEHADALAVVTNSDTVNAVVAHERAMNVASVAVLNLEFEDIKIGLEPSPQNLRGLSHRELGDCTDALAMLFEACNASQGRLRGATDARITNRQQKVLQDSIVGIRAIRQKIDVAQIGFTVDLKTAQHLDAQCMPGGHGLFPTRCCIVISQRDRREGAFFRELHHLGRRENTIGRGTVHVQIDTCHENPFVAMMCDFTALPRSTR